MLTFALFVACSTSPEPPADYIRSTDAPSSIDTSTTRSDTGTSQPTDTGTPTTTSSSTTFTAATGDTGAPSLIGRTFIFDPGAMQFVSPPALGAAIPTGLLPTAALMQVIAEAPPELTVRVGWTNAAGSQDVCAPTIDVVLDTSVSPAVAGPADVDVVFLRSPMVLQQASLELTFNATYDRITDASVAAVVDTVPHAEGLAGPGTPANAVCQALVKAAGGWVCDACPSDPTNPYCLPFRTAGGRAQVDGSLSVVERTVADVDADASCP